MCFFAGLVTLAKKMLNQPIKTFQAGKEMKKSYDDMKKKNVIGGNLAAHEEANQRAAEKSDAETAAAFSALREQSKRFRPGITKNRADKSRHIGDTRSQKEIDDTMNANKRGREKAG